MAGGVSPHAMNVVVEGLDNTDSDVEIHPGQQVLYSVHVHHLPLYITKEEVQMMFAPYGEIGDLFIQPQEDDSGYTYGFVRYQEQASAEYAIDSLDNTYFQKHRIRVSWAKSPLCPENMFGRDQPPRSSRPRSANKTRRENQQHDQKYMKYLLTQFEEAYRLGHDGNSGTDSQLVEAFNNLMHLMPHEPQKLAPTITVPHEDLRININDFETPAPGKTDPKQASKSSGLQPDRATNGPSFTTDKKPVYLVNKEQLRPTPQEKRSRNVSASPNSSHNEADSRRVGLSEDELSDGEPLLVAGAARGAAAHSGSSNVEDENLSFAGARAKTPPSSTKHATSVYGVSNDRYALPRKPTPDGLSRGTSKLEGERMSLGKPYAESSITTTPLPTDKQSGPSKLTQTMLPTETVSRDNIPHSTMGTGLHPTGVQTSAHCYSGVKDENGHLSARPAIPGIEKLETIKNENDNIPVMKNPPAPQRVATVQMHSNIHDDLRGNPEIQDNVQHGHIQNSRAALVAENGGDHRNFHGNSPPVTRNHAGGYKGTETNTAPVTLNHAKINQTKDSNLDVNHLKTDYKKNAVKDVANFKEEMKYIPHQKERAVAREPPSWLRGSGSLDSSSEEEDDRIIPHPEPTSSGKQTNSDRTLPETGKVRSEIAGPSPSLSNDQTIAKNQETTCISELDGPVVVEIEDQNPDDLPPLSPLEASIGAIMHVKSTEQSISNRHTLGWGRAKEALSCGCPPGHQPAAHQRHPSYPQPSHQAHAFVVPRIGARSRSLGGEFPNTQFPLGNPQEKSNMDENHENETASSVALGRGRYFTP